MSNDVFRYRDLVAEQMDLPGEVGYSFVGPSTPEYHAKLEEIMIRNAGEENIRRRTHRASGKGTYTAYRFDVFHMALEEVEAIYREVTKLEGTRFVI